MNLIPSTKVFVISAAVALAGIVGWTVWHRIDAVRDAELRNRAKQDAARIEHIETAKERRDEIDQMDCDELLRSALERLSDGGDDRSALARCGEGAP